MKWINLIVFFGVTCFGFHWLGAQTNQDASVVNSKTVSTEKVNALPSISKTKDLIEDGPTYPWRNRFSRPLGEDGYPIRGEQFVFTVDESRNYNDLAVMKSALKREQRRLTKIFFMEHPSFQNYKQNILANLIDEAANNLDKGIDDAKNMYVLANFSFENFRAHLLRVSSFIITTRQLRLTNLTGSEGKTLISKVMPHEPYEIVALVSLILNILLGTYVIFDKK
ncbi:MAG: hypothetical protein WA160_05465 [Pseudobdellovibrio sp.]